MNLSYIKSLKPPIAVIGLGKSGLAAAAVLRASGFTESDLLLFDEKDSSAQISDVATLVSLQPKTLVVSPGVPLKLGWIQELIAGGAQLTSEINLAASLLTTEKVIGITGSVGKSTVTSILGAGLKSFEETSFVGGNLGTAFCEYALARLKSAPAARWIVLELSSYQLENCDQLKLHASVITYLSPNHMERYENLAHYYNTKMKITGLTETFCLFNKTSADCAAYAEKSFCKYFLINSESSAIQNYLPKLFLIGAHNRDNFTLAAEMALRLGWPEKSIQAMSEYRGLPHRLEFVANQNGITYVNDSKATAMDSVLVAVKACLESLPDGKNLYLLLGGKDKNLPWQELAVLKNSHTIQPIFFGACGELARDKSALSGEYFDKLGSAIGYAQRRAQNGDVVLLSPGGTSLDEFKNFEERGDFFKCLVK